MSVRRSRRALALVLVPLAVAACEVFAPFRDKIRVGQEPYAIFSARSRAGEIDLFGMPPAGKPLMQVTYGRAIERRPALSQDGAVVAFLRTMDPADSGGTPWMLNLLNGNERETPLPAEAGTPRALAFDTNGTLVVRTDRGDWRVTPPPGDVRIAAVPAAERAHVDSLFLVLLGRPAFARAERCASGGGLCAVDRAGSSSELAAAGRDPAAWGADSVAWWSGDTLVVRPLGPGRFRKLPMTVRDIEGLAAFVPAR